MSKCAKTINWQGGTHVFDLNHPRSSWMLQLHQAPFPGQWGDTPAACLRRFDEGVYSPTDVEQIFRIGLIGGGLTENEADLLVKQHVRNQALGANATVAFAVLAALFLGVDDDVSASA